MTQDPNEWAKRAFDGSDRRFESQINAALDSAKQAIQALLLLNGTACIAILTFLGSTLGKNDLSPYTQALANRMLNSLSFFAVGAALAVLTSLLAYIVNRCYAEAIYQEDRNYDWPYLHDTTASKTYALTGAILNWVAIAAGMIGLGCFVYGLHTIRSLFEVF